MKDISPYIVNRLRTMNKKSLKYTIGAMGKRLRRTI
jgi:hypothetical protein